MNIEAQPSGPLNPVVFSGQWQVMTAFRSSMPAHQRVACPQSPQPASRAAIRSASDQCPLDKPSLSSLSRPPGAKRGGDRVAGLGIELIVKT